MRKITVCVCALSLALFCSVAARAASFSIVGGGNLPDGTTGGTLDIVYDPAPQNNISFSLGGVQLAVTSSTPGVIKFTTAQVVNGGRWNGVLSGGITPDAVGFMNAASAGTPGLSTSASSIHATIAYEVIGPGTTDLLLTTQGEDALYDGQLGDVSGMVALNGASLTVPGGVPEPATLAMAGLGLVGLALRRRNG